MRYTSILILGEVLHWHYTKLYNFSGELQYIVWHFILLVWVSTADDQILDMCLFKYRLYSLCYIQLDKIIVTKWLTSSDEEKIRVIVPLTKEELRMIYSSASDAPTLQQYATVLQTEVRQKSMKCKNPFCVYNCINISLTILGDVWHPRSISVLSMLCTQGLNTCLSKYATINSELFNVPSHNPLADEIAKMQYKRHSF